MIARGEICLNLKMLSKSSYTRSVTKSTQRLEALLKVVVTPQVRDIIMGHVTLTDTALRTQLKVLSLTIPF